jgi:hypothetical protein
MTAATTAASLEDSSLPATTPISRPSGYTSRSIVSLSGLSVSDPLPGSYETAVLTEHRKRRSSSISSLQDNKGGADREDDIPTTTFHYNPRLVRCLSPLLSAFSFFV